AYYLKFPAADSVHITGAEVKECVFLQVSAGWNLISGLSCSIPVNAIDDPGQVLIPGTIFGFNGTYYSADTLKQGTGYWMRCSSNGMISICCE
ncbi:MAG: hypothetical protein WAN36_07935, partial [Calditrichia bacterium]